MAQLKDLIVNGPSRFIGDVYATTFTGNLEGNASTATTAAICTGNSATATALTTNAGSTNTPVYFTGGKPSSISIIAGTADIERPLVVVTDNNELYKTSGITANYSKNSITATTFKGNLEGNASTATSATTAAALTGKTLVTASAVTTSNWSTYGNNHIPTMSFMAYWNGAYSGTSSNLTYCAQGTIIGSKNIGSQSVNFATSSGSCSGNAATATKATQDGNGNVITSTYLPLSGGTMSNTNVVTNLNADLLDGLHAASFYQCKPIRSDQNSIYDLRFNYGTYDKGDYGGTYNGEYPTNYGAYLALTYSDKNIGALMFFDAPTSNVLGHIYVRTRGAGDKKTTYSKWGTLAYLTDNIASSSKWANARTITLTGSVTGSVSLDGSGDVSLVTTTNHTHTFASLTSKPTTLSGYGITDAYTKTETNTKLNGYLPLTGGTINGNLQIGANDNTSDKYLMLVRNNHFIRINNTDLNAYFTFGTMSDTGSLTDERILRLGDNGLRYSPNASTYYDILHTGNYNSYSPKLDGTGATGTWNINISGNAATATKATQDGNGNVITSTYLPVSSGTINAICTTIASVGAKKAASHNFILTTGVSILITFTVSNTHQNKMTLNVNETGAKTLYINDKVSSTTNYTIPAGTYNCYYNGSYWYLDTGNAFKAETFIVSQLKAASGYCLLYGSTVANAALHIGVISPNTSYPYTTYSLYMARKGIAVGGFASTSDMTMKDRIEDLRLNFDDVASMPVFKFRWKDREAHGDSINVGTSAQYWVSKEPLLVDGTEGSYSIQYGVLALACVKTTAEKVKELEDKVLELQKEIKALKAL